MSAEEPSDIENWVRLRVLGSGGFGVVTLWKHKSENQMIALKKCRWGTDQILTLKHKERWSKEVEIMQRLDHPNVVRAIAVPPELMAVLKSQLPMLCMEYCSKGDLRQVLNRPENCCGLREVDVRAIISDVSSAVQYLHYMKITHRDLKPENIVLQPGEQRVSYKLIDLGYAKELDQSSICTSFVGTLQYLAPELFMSKNYTCSVDYWSLGLVSHEVMTGVRPFLPNMPPAAWMHHVGSKSFDDISAHQAPDGTIIFSKELFPQNHISSCLKYYMERWLKICLEWEPRKRGRDVNMGGEITVFQLIDDILSKTMLNVYDATHYQTLSYEIDNSTAVTTLQRWIERDTGLLEKDQELLLLDGRSVDKEREAWHCIPLHGSLQDPAVFVFKHGSLRVPEVTPEIPASVSAMMSEPRNQVVYTHQIRSYAHAVFFVNKERDLHKTFRKAAIVKLLRLSHTSRNLSQDLASAINCLNQVEAKHQLTTTALEFDHEQARKMSPAFDNVMQHWKKSNDAIRRQLDKLREVTSCLKGKCDTVVRKTNELGSSPFLNTTMDLENFNPLVESSMKCYENLRKRPKDKRDQKSDSVDMVKIVYNCLKSRDKLLRDTDFNSYLQLIVDIQSAADKLGGPICSCVEMTNRVQIDLEKTFKARQTDIWSHFNTISKQSNGLDSEMIPQEPVESLSKIPNIPQPIEPQQRPQNVIHVPKASIATPLPSVLQENLHHFIIQAGNTGAMIDDNIALRYETQDVMNESYQKYRSILTEDSFDWDFIK